MPARLRFPESVGDGDGRETARRDSSVAIHPACFFRQCFRTALRVAYERLHWRQRKACVPLVVSVTTSQHSIAVPLGRS